MPKVRVTQGAAPRTGEDQLVTIYVTHALDMLTDDRHDRCRYDDHAFARTRFRWSEAEPAAAAGSGLGRPARRSGPGRLTPIPRSKRLIAVVIGREVQASTFILPG